MKNTVTTVLAIIFLTILGWGLYSLLERSVEFDNNQHTIDSLLSEVDSMRYVVLDLDSVANQKEAKYREDVKTIKGYYETQITKLQKRAIKERTEIKNLPIDDQVALLDANIWQTDIEPKLLLMNKDTVIQLAPIHVVSINQMYNDLEIINEQYELCKDSRDSLSGYINQGLEIIDMKNEEIKALKQLDTNNELIIQHLNRTLENGDKRRKKDIKRAAVISVVAGTLIGLIIH